MEAIPAPLASPPEYHAEWLLRLGQSEHDILSE